MRFLRLLAVILYLTGPGVLAADAQVQGVRLWAAPDNTRVVLDVSAPVDHKVFTLSGPDRLVIDLNNSRMAASLAELDLSNGLVAKIRSGARDGGGLRLVLDLRAGVQPKSFLLKPNETYGHRLVIDLFGAAPPSATTAAATRVTEPDAAPPRPTEVVPNDERQSRQLVIAIDAGHGGEDPGARGRAGTREKDVVLSIARRTADLINKEPGMRAVMIRDGDYYVGLRNRIKKAREHRADLLVSIHADAFKDHRVTGSSVYVVSQRGASNEMARWLAERENAADLVGGVSLDDKDDLLKTVLLDLSQSATIEASLDVGGNVLGELKRVGKVHRNQVQQAGFVVLKSPDIPSILVETAFISNPHEEKRLRDPQHQRSLANAIVKGVRSYFARHAPPGTLVAERQHKIQHGETLSGIAQQYRVSVDHLRLANKLGSDVLRAGEILRIPGADDG